MFEGTSDMLSVLSSEAGTTSWEIASNEGRNGKERQEDVTVQKKRKHEQGKKNKVE
jgi:hypothetical protein